MLFIAVKHRKKHKQKNNLQSFTEVVLILVKGLKLNSNVSNKAYIITGLKALALPYNH